MNIDASTLRRLYPFTSHWLEVGGVRLHYVDEGRGAPVVLVHGNPSWSLMFRDLIRELRQTHRVIALDHVGCGLSDKPHPRDYPYTLRRRVRDLESLLDHLGLDRDLTLVMHDWGGMIGTACALRRRAALRGLVYLNTAAFLLPSGKRLPWRLRLIRDWRPLGSLLVQGANAFALGAAFMATTRGLAPQVRRAYLAPYDTWHNRIATLRFVQDIPLKPADPSYELARWVDRNLHTLADVPVLIGWGGRDFVFDRAFLDQWRRRLPRAEVHEFPEAGHYVLEDAGGELVGLIADFVRRALPPAPADSSPSSAGRCESAAPTQPLPEREGSRKAPAPFPGSAENRAASLNMAARLSAVAQELADKPAVIQRARLGSWHAGGMGAQVSFGQLDDAVRRLARGLREAGIGRGTRTIVMVRPGPELFALTFALFRVGAVPVLIDPGMGRQNLVRCLAQVRAAAFVGIPLAHLLRRLHRHELSTIRTCVTVGPRLPGCGVSLARLLACPPDDQPPVELEPDEPAAILFTSGSTGPAKGVVYTQGIFAAQVDALAAHFGCGPHDTDLATFPLFALFDAALGMTAVVPDMDATRPGAVDPREIVDAIHSHGCTHMFGSPALLERVARWAVPRGVRLLTLRQVITAGAPVRPDILERFTRLLVPDAQVLTPYGATEALPVACISSHEILSETRRLTAAGAGTCVGRPLPGMDVRIIEVSDEPLAGWQEVRELPGGEAGEIVVSGPVVTREYYLQPAATAAAKIRDGGRIWHRTGDVGYFDQQGRLWFCGRKAHRVETADGRLLTVCCEAIFNQHPAVRRAALVGVGPPGAQRPVICVELEPAQRRVDWHRLCGELRAMARAHAHTRQIDTFLRHRGFPVDVRHNAKIFREKLALWAARQLEH